MLSRRARCALLFLVCAAALVTRGGIGAFTFPPGTPGTITTVAGGGVGDGGPATAAMLNLYSTDAHTVADAGGRLYVSDVWDCRIRLVNGGTITTVAGSGSCVSSGDGGPAAAAGLHPGALALSNAGDLYFVDVDACRVRKLSGGVVSAVAGTGTCGFSGDGGPATAAQLNQPQGLAVDGAGNVFISDTQNCVVREVTGSGVITTFAGDHPYCYFYGDGGPATGAALSPPHGIAFDGAGTLYIADTGDCRVRQVSGGVISTFAGTYVGPGACTSSGDGGPASSAGLALPTDLAIDAAGDMYLMEACRIRKVSGGTITTVAGTGTCGASADGGPAATSQIDNHALGAAPSGDFFISENCRLRRVAAGTITTVAGNNLCSYDNEGGAATAAAVLPDGLGLDSGGNLYINQVFRISKVTGGVITTVAGGGECCYSGDGGPAIGAGIDIPYDMVVAGNGDLYLGNFGCRIRKVSGGMINTIAGTGACHEGPDGPVSGTMIEPDRMTIDGAGNLYFYDQQRCQLREISGGMLITLVSADAPPCGSFGGVQDIVADAAGHVFLQGLCATREWSGGAITPVPGASCADSGVTGGYRIAVDAAGNLFIADRNNCTITQVTGGVATRVAGSGVCTYTGEGQVPTQSGMDPPQDIAVDGAGDLYVGGFPVNGSQSNTRVREVLAPGPDSDGDGYSDAFESALGKNPNVYCAIMRADVNMDGAVNALDLNLLGKHFLQSVNIANQRLDENADGAINALDLNLIGKKFLHSISECP